MKAENQLKSDLWNRLDQFRLSDQKKDQLIIELDSLSKLIIDSYLEQKYNKDKERVGAKNG